MDTSELVWVFNGQHASFPSGVFRSLEKARSWIEKHSLTGTLTAYPLDAGAYDWALEHRRFTPKSDAQRASTFVGNFTNAGIDHIHFENGRG